MAPAADPEKTPPADRWQKVAVLMVSLGQELASELLRQFDDEDVGHITGAIAGLKNVPRQVQEQVLAEFEDDLRCGRLPVTGGAAFARGMLQSALGVERADEMWSRLQGPRRPAFEALNEADPHQVAPCIGREHPQTIALILSQLRPQQSAAILEQLPQAAQGEVTHRIATLERVSPEILEQVEAGLSDVLSQVLSGQQQVEGPKVAADILNRVGASLERNLLQRLDAADPEVAEAIRSRMFTFGDVASLSEADARALLENVDTNDLLVSLKAAPKGVLDRVLSVVSERRRERLLEDISMLPKMRLSEVEEAQLRVVQALRQLEEQGIVDLSRDVEVDPHV